MRFAHTLEAGSGIFRDDFLLHIVQIGRDQTEARDARFAKQARDGLGSAGHRNTDCVANRGTKSGILLNPKPTTRGAVPTDRIDFGVH